MAFKIPKKQRQGAEPETDIVVMQSPLSRLQDSTSVATNGWGVANGARGRPNATGKDAMQRPAVKQNLRSVIGKLLRIVEPTRAGPVTSLANQRGSATARETPSSNRASDGHGRSGQPAAGTARTQQAASNGWRPRRASDRLLPSVSAPIEDDSQRKKDSVVSVDSSEQDTPGRTSSDRPRDTRGQSQQGVTTRAPFHWSSSPSSSSSSPSSSPPPALRTAPPPVLSTSLAPRKTSGGGRLSLGARRTLGDDTRSSVFTRLGRPAAAKVKPTEPIVLSSEEDDMEDIACGVKTLDAPEGSRRVQDAPEGSRRVQDAPEGFRRVQDGAGAAETCPEASRTARTCSEDPRAVRTCSEASRRDETSSEGAWTVETSPAVTRTCSEASRRVETTSERPWTAETSPAAVRTCSETSRTVETTSEGSRTVATSPEASRIVLDDVSPPPPSGVGASSSSSSTMELQFSRLILGQLSAQAHGNLLITESYIFLPLKGLHMDSEVEAESLSVAVVTSQLRGYGVWGEGVATGSHAPSLLFLWVTDSHAKLLQTELSVLQPITAADGACPFILVELTSPLAGLRFALLRSRLDMCGTAACCSVSVGVSHALSLMHEHPLMLALLGHDTTGVSSRLRRKAANCLTTRLIQYPLTQGKGRIAVTLEDLSCLNEGEFLNDVIIDFYLKYLLLECSGNLSERCHVFSSFFYRQLTKRRTTEEEPQPLDKVGRHQRVKTWTRNVDIFDKDFLFVPVNQEAHWYLVVVCFPGLVKDQMEETNASCVPMTPREEQEVKRPRLTRDMLPRGPPPVRSRGPPPECTMLGWKKETVLKRPCILVMDSLKRLSSHEKIENVCRLLREYMHVEWTQRRPTTRLFSSTNMRSSRCTLPLQDNSSDCGLYLLQYVETFLKNPVVHFDLPVCLNNWFPRQLVRKKREDIRQLVMEMNQRQTSDQPL